MFESLTDHRPGRFEVSLKSLFLLTLLVATFCAGYTLATKQAEQAIQAEQEARRAAEETARQEVIRRLDLSELNFDF